MTTSDARASVLLFHSSASSSRQWRALAAQLEPHYHVHAVDLHGHGRRQPWCGDSPLTLADEAALAVPLLPPQGAHVIGHSYGGAVALRLALMVPHAVRSVLVYEPVLASWLLDDDAASPAAREFVAVGAFVERALTRGEHALAAWHFVDYWSGPGTWTALSDERQAALSQLMPAVSAHFGALLADRLSPVQLAALEIPIMCVHGAQARASTRRVAQLLRAVLPAARHELLHGMGHMGPITHAEEVNALMRSFIESRLPAMPLDTIALAGA